MGACLCPPDDCDVSCRGPSAPLSFHPYVKGSQIAMDESHRAARRVATFRNGLVFSNRPIELYEKVALRICKEDSKWHGGLRLGFTWEDPSRLGSLPPFACPNLVRRGKTRACLLPDECCEEGTVVGFWVDSRGRVFCSVNEEPEHLLLLDGVSVTSPLWAVMDIYGRTRAIQLLDASSLAVNHDIHTPLPSTCNVFNESNRRGFSHLSGKGSRDECVICLERKPNTTMLPCSHANFCTRCSLKVLKTSGRCPLCRRDVKKILHFSVF